MNKETIVTSAFCVHRSKFICSLAAALLDGLFEQPAGRHCITQRRGVHTYVDHVHLYVLVVQEDIDCRDRDGGHEPSRCLIS